MSVLITAATNSAAFQLARILNTEDICFASDTDIPVFSGKRFLKFPSTDSSSFIHEVLKICLDNQIVEIYPLLPDEIVEFSKSTHNVCMCLGLSVILIILFILTPLNTFMLPSMFGKIIIIALLGYTLYYNTTQTNKFSKNFNVNILNQTENWNPIKTNIICSYIFSLFVLVLIISVIRTIFKVL